MLGPFCSDGRGPYYQRRRLPHEMGRARFPHSGNPVLQNLNENHGSGVKAEHLQSSAHRSISRYPQSPASKLQSMASQHHHSHGDHDHDHHTHGCALAILHCPLFRSVIAVRTSDSLPVWPCDLRDGAASGGGGSWIGEDSRVWHSHDGLAPHSHEPIYSPGDFTKRAPPLASRSFADRAFTVGIGGPVGTGYFWPFPA
jgi:hypothetical protein